MSEMTLVRHGQASLGAENYDELSPLGVQQAVWLGEYFAEREMVFDQVVVGGQHRHRQTLDGISGALSLPPPDAPDTRLNELDFQCLLAAFLAHNPNHPRPARGDVRGIFSTFKLAMLAWGDGAFGDEMPETAQQFIDRVGHFVEAITQQSSARNILVVSSGGPISTVLKHTMGFGLDTLVGLQVQGRNTGLSHLYFNQSSTYVTSFNNVPHLDHPDRLHAITHA
ncbi:MAG: histidine phosphatase family protein [Lysobacterales bacterium]